MSKFTYAFFTPEKLQALLMRLAGIKASGASSTTFDGQTISFRSSKELQAEIDAIGAQLQLVAPNDIPRVTRRRRRGLKLAAGNKGFR